MNSKYITEPFDNKNHIFKDFKCGVKELEIYLKERASQDVRNNVSAVYILRESTSLKIIGTLP